MILPAAFLSGACIAVLILSPTFPAILQPSLGDYSKLVELMANCSRLQGEGIPFRIQDAKNAGLPFEPVPLATCHPGDNTVLVAPSSPFIDHVNAMKKYQLDIDRANREMTNAPIPILSMLAWFASFGIFGSVGFALWGLLFKGKRASTLHLTGYMILAAIFADAVCLIVFPFHFGAVTAVVLTGVALIVGLGIEDATLVSRALIKKYLSI